MSALSDHGPLPKMWLGGVVPGTTRALMAHYERESVRLAEEAARLRVKARGAKTHALMLHFRAEARSLSAQARDAAQRSGCLELLWRSGSKKDSPRSLSHHPTLPRSWVTDEQEEK